MSRILSFILFLYPLLSFGQDIIDFENPQAKISIKNLDLISFDTKDQIFASTTSGDIFLFNSKGDQLNLYSPTRQGRLQQLEAAWTVNIFSFSSDLQEYRILDRFMSLLSENGFFQVDIGLAKAATLGNNNIIWVWDESDLNLKILDFRRNLIIRPQPLNLILKSKNLEVLEIREFKNRLFMNVKNDGVFMFDNQGNFVEKINLKTDQRLCFYNEHLLWIEEKTLMAISLKNQETLEIAKIPNPEFKGVQIGQEKLALVSDDKIIIFPMPERIKQLK